MKAAGIKSYTPGFDKALRKATVLRMRDHQRRHAAASPKVKLEDLVRITVNGKSYHLESLSNRKKRMVRFNLVNPAVLRERLA